MRWTLTKKNKKPNTNNTKLTRCSKNKPRGATKKVKKKGLPEGGESWHLRLPTIRNSTSTLHGVENRGRKLQREEENIVRGKGAPLLL